MRTRNGSRQPARCPGLGQQTPLRGESSGDGGEGGGERGLHGIADDLVEMTAVAGDGLPQDGVVPGIRRGHGIWEIAPEARAPLQIGEEEGHGAAGPLNHQVPRIANVS